MRRMTDRWLQVRLTDMNNGTSHTGNCAVNSTCPLVLRSAPHIENHWLWELAIRDPGPGKFSSRPGIQISRVLKFRTLTKRSSATYLLDFPVTVSVNVRRMFGGRISSFNTFDSVANGNPLSSISSSSYHANTQSQFLVNKANKGLILF